MFPATEVVRVVIVGTVLALILNVLVDVALLKLVIVPELARLTMPPALLVIPAIVPDPWRFNVPVLIKFKRTVLIAPEPVIVAVPKFVSNVIEQVPPIFNVPVALLVRLLAPARADATVNIPLLVVVPLIVT